MPSFAYGDHELSYDVRGDGERPFVLLHGLLLNRRMHHVLADTLAECGNRVILLDLLGHGESSRPRDMTLYTMSQFGRQLVALLDHLGLQEAVIGGTSLGANTALEAAIRDPERVRGMVVEMPVLDNALLACAVAFTPMLAVLRYAEPVMQVVAGIARRIPRQVPLLPGEELRAMVLDAFSQDPGPSASVLEGVLFGRAAPPTQERRHVEAPTLVIGHPRDAIHPFSDALMLADELPNGRLLEADSIAELWLEPERLTAEITEFLDECWKPRAARAAAGAAS